MALAEVNAARSKEQGARTVTVIRDKMPDDLPELWLEVYIEGPRFEHQAFANMLGRAKCRRAATPDDADLVIFTGGEDVNPLLYGKQPHSTTCYDNRRDEIDMALYEKCVTEGIPMFGVCRGAQFLHVMNGGKLYQDIDRHQGAHMMYDPIARRVLRNVSSVHHQSCIPNTEGGQVILGECNISSKRWLDDCNFRTGTAMDVEAYWYPDTFCLGVQGHPEYKGYEEYTAWCLKQIYDYIVINTDIELVGRVRRVKNSVRDMRTEAVKNMLKEVN